MKATQHALPLPDASLLCTKGAAALRLNMHVTTVGRLIKAGKLTPLAPRSAPGERMPVLLACAEVDAYRAALQTVRGG